MFNSKKNSKKSSFNQGTVVENGTIPIKTICHISQDFKSKSCGISLTCEGKAYKPKETILKTMKEDS
jgi:hypothetical protein